ncbi:unnamed protein product [Meloidogyne enterolobii]|uniref:Uncharacterized protein n=1 Tax=Meloidogyne enterolobii TaxID=390850 RepID=A0ACB0Z2X6_MELEN
MDVFDTGIFGTHITLLWIANPISWKLICYHNCWVLSSLFHYWQFLTSIAY